MAKREGEAPGTTQKGAASSVSSKPPAAEPLDVTWDDDTVPRLEFEDPGFDRVTAIPELPPELYAKMMEAAHEAIAREQNEAKLDPAPAVAAPAAAPPPPAAPPRAPSASPLPFELEAALLGATVPRESPKEHEPPRSSRS